MKLLALSLLLAGCGRLDFAAGNDNGLVAYYPLDEITANGTDDLLGGPRALCVPSCPVLVPGRVGRAVHYSSIGQHLEVASTAALETTNAFTVAAWAIWDGGAAGYSCIATKTVGPDVQNSWTICMQTDDRVFFGTSQSDAVVMLYSNSTVSPGGWHHVAVSWDGTAKKIWIDGALDATANGATEIDSGPVSIGGDEDTGTPADFFFGTIDEVRVYNRELSADEIAALAR